MFFSFYLNIFFSLETDVFLEQDRPFTLSSNDCKAWATQGSNLLANFKADESEYNNL